MISELILTLTGYTVALAAMVRDIEERVVPNHYWLIAGLVSVPALIATGIEDPAAMKQRLLWGGSLSGLAVLAWVGRTYEGADAKGTITLAFLLPPVAWNLHPVLLALIASIGISLLIRRPHPFFAHYTPLVIAASVLIPSQ